MRTIKAARARPVGLTTFADLTDKPLVSIDRDGLTFDGELTPEECDAIWWRVTSKDDADEAERRHIKALADDEENPLVRALAYRHLGFPVPTT